MEKELGEKEGEGGRTFFFLLPRMVVASKRGGKIYKGLSSTPKETRRWTRPDISSRAWVKKKCDMFQTQQLYK